MRTLPITDYPNYLISEFGDVINKSTGKTLKPIRHKNGYMFVDLFNNKGHKILSIHRIVAISFLPNPNNLPCVNHKDETRDNNAVDNLEWCSYKYNSNYGTAIKRRINHTDYSRPIYKKLASNNSMKLCRPVSRLTIDGTIIDTFSSAAEAIEKLGFKSSHISACCKGKRKSSNGYIWKYAERSDVISQSQF